MSETRPSGPTHSLSLSLCCTSITLNDMKYKSRLYPWEKDEKNSVYLQLAVQIRCWFGASVKAIKQIYVSD